MKFGETLSTHLTPEWRKQYIMYSVLRRMIYDAIDNFSDDIKSSRKRESFIARFDEEFFRECEKELLKIDSFFAEKLAEAKRKFQEMRVELECFANSQKNLKSQSTLNLSKMLPKTKANHFKFIVSEYYLSLVLLEKYQSLNHTGFRKILKKYDKHFQANTGDTWFKTHVENANFATNKEINNLITDTETLFTKYLEDGDRSKAMKRLRVPPFEELQSPWRTFRLGLAMGAFICLCGFIIITINNLKISSTDYEIFKQLHRPSLLVTLFLFLMGLNVYGWQKAGVNHILIFEIDPREHLTATHLLEIAAFLALLTAFSFLACLLLAEPLSRFAYPLILTAIFFVFWFNPLPLQWSSRSWLMKVVGRIICAPFFKVNFADFWLADQLNSLTLMFCDYGFFGCFYTTNLNWDIKPSINQCKGQYENISYAIIHSLPAWWRLAQCFRRLYDSKRCFPHLLNAGKYASIFPVNGFKAVVGANAYDFYKMKENPYFWCLILSRIINTTWCYLWDILMDFGLFRKFTKEHMFLREEILYTQSVYYIIAVEDLLLRFYWIFAMFVTSNNLMSAFNVSTLGAVLEILRRYIWNFIRLENEHLNNVGLFRAVRDISVVPLTTDDQKRLQKLMDRPDGVVNGRRSLTDDEDDD